MDQKLHQLKRNTSNPKSGQSSIMATIGPLAELMRLHRPVGILNIFFPYMYGFFYTSLVTNPTPPIVQTLFVRLPLLFFSAFILRSLGCAWNDVVDMEIDKRVERTRIRPLARGAISPAAAYALCLALLAGWTATLTFLLLDLDRLLAYAVPLTAMVAAYPYMKRITSYAQVWLGLTLAWGVLFGGAIAGFDVIAHVRQTVSASATSNQALSAVFADSQVWGLGALYLVYVTWSVIHDTIYAFQDYKDDKLVGVKSMALRLSGTTKPVLWTLSEVQVLLLIAACLTMVPTTTESQTPQWAQLPGLILGTLHGRWIFLVTAVLGNAIVLSLMVGKVDLSDAQDCARWFKTGSIWVGSSIGLGFLLEYVWQAAF